MSRDDQNDVLFGNGDERPSNHCGNPHMSELIDQRRRQILAGGAALGALGFLGVLPQAVVVGDGRGYLHFLRPESGELAARLRPDSSAIVAIAVSPPRHPMAPDS